MILLRACLLTVVALAWPAFAQTDVHGLKDAFKGKQFELRNFSAEPVTRYTWESGELRTLAVDVHSLGVFIVSDVAMKGPKLEIRGIRATLLRDVNSKKLGLAGKSVATLEVEMNGADPAAVLPQLRDELFFPDLDSAIAGLPQPQAKDIEDMLMGRGASVDSCHCTKFQRGKEWIEVPNRDPKLKAPVVVVNAEPAYTDLARQARVNGTVRLLLGVDAQGKPTDLWLLKSLGYGLDEAAEEAVRKSKFAPAVYDGQPMAVELTMEISFKIS